MRFSWTRRLATFGLLLAVTAGCGEGGSAFTDSLAQATVPVTTRFAAVQDDVGTEAELLLGPPAAYTGESGLDADGTAIAAAISGGTTLIELSSASMPFSVVQVSIVDLILLWELTLPAPKMTVQMPVTFSTTIPIEPFTAVFRLGDGNGNWGEEFTVDMLPLDIPSGEVQISVSWNAPSDVDLHAIEPPNGTGERIYFANETSANGGSLDLDSNPACNIDNVNNESIHWEEGDAPTGEYAVEVNYFDSCGEDSDYVVTIQRKDRDPLVFTGSFVNGESGLTHFITFFDYP